MEGVAAPTSEDSLKREAQGGARRYVSRHQVSPDAWSSPTLLPSAEIECTPQSQSRPPITLVQRNAASWSVEYSRLSASGELGRWAANDVLLFLLGFVLTFPVRHFKRLNTQFPVPCSLPAESGLAASKFAWLHCRFSYQLNDHLMYSCKKWLQHWE